MYVYVQYISTYVHTYCTCILCEFCSMIAVCVGCTVQLQTLCNCPVCPYHSLPLSENLSVSKICEYFLKGVPAMWTSLSLREFLQ